MNNNYKKEDFFETLNKDSLFLSTGFLLLEDADYNYWYYYKKRGILFPYKQEYTLQPYETDDAVSDSNQIKIDANWYPYQFPDKENAEEFFSALSKISALKECRIEGRIWMLSDYDFLYNGYTKSIISRESIYDPKNRIFPFRCVYLEHYQAEEEDTGWLSACVSWSRLNLCPASMKEEFRNVVKQLAIPEILEMDIKTQPQKTLQPAAQVRTKKHFSSANTTKLLDCDKRRCGLDSYGENILYDFKCGHWDLFEPDADIRHTHEKKMFPRDPRLDIKRGIVGIDFGTKSTIVVCQNDTSQIIPVCIGAGASSGRKKTSGYENPTVIECINLNGFVEKYLEKTGRPETNCEDFLISHDAWNHYCSCPPHEFYSYFTELKQWADCPQAKVTVMDKKGRQYLLGTDTSEKEQTINPIELYAYYIGMHLNNMKNGIYMNYLLSYPVECSKESRQLITDSFEKGIKKSLPSSLLEDESCMEKFSVHLGISEPAAYAAAALEMSRLEPKDENEEYMFSVFDFGGRRTDYIFGVWRGASEKEYETEGYNYVMECLGSGSDPALGGESILELLACTVLDHNRDLIKRKNLALPEGDTFLSHSRAARQNMAFLKEKLRPLWHQEDNWQEQYVHIQDNDNKQKAREHPEEYIELSMYDKSEKLQPDCRFLIDIDELIQIIKMRIQKGVSAFFRCMEKVFQTEEKAQRQEGNMYIFLAGNAGKSVFTEEIFQKTIDHYYQEFQKIDRNAGTSYFTLISPQNIENTGGQQYTPDAKSLAAYGLLKSREGSSIKIEKCKRTDTGAQGRFRYYLGRERRRRFECRLSPLETAYGAWICFQGASRPIVRIYYTTDPMADASSEQLAIDHIRYKEISIEPEEDAFLFIRAYQPTVIEYTVSHSEDMITDACEIRKIDFGSNTLYYKENEGYAT